MIKKLHFFVAFLLLSVSAYAGPWAAHELMTSAKMNALDANTVHISGDETITGNKTFVHDVLAPNIVAYSAYSTAKAQAIESARNSELSAVLASTQAGIATTQATNAANSVISAANSVAAAAASATSATNAQNAAIAAQNVAMTNATNSATSATNAAGSATSSAGSATSATTSATNAANSATSASGYANTASTKATNAASSATAAATSASGAATSATNAGSSASAASLSATNAATSASSAGTFASQASVSAGNAASSATTAGNYATNASNSATTATTQATNASNSATSAATSATAAANSASSAGSSASAAANSASSASTSATNAGNSASSATASSLSASSSYNASLLNSFSGAFIDPLNELTATTYGTPNSPGLSGSSYTVVVDATAPIGGKILKVVGGGYVSTRKLYPIDLNKTYKLTVLVKQISDASPSTVYAGFLCERGDYGAVGALWSGTAGTSLTVAQGWVTYSATLTGSSWLSGTKFATVTFVTNSGSVEIAQMSLEDITQATNAATSATAAATQATNASTSATAAATSASSASTSATNAATSATAAQSSATLAQSSSTSASGYAATAQTAASSANASANQYSAQYTLKVDANGKVAGIGLFSDSTTGTQVQIQANKFAIVDPANEGTVKVPFIVSGGVVYIDSAVIQSVDAGKITTGTLTGRTIQTAASGQRFTVDSVVQGAKFYDSTGSQQIWLGTGSSDSVNAYGVFGSTSTSANRIGLYGAAHDQVGVYGSSIDSIGTYGKSLNVNGVKGESTNAAGIVGTSVNGVGGIFQGGNGAIVLNPTSSIPSARTSGMLINYSGSGMGGSGLYYADGMYLHKISTSGNY